MKNKEWTKWNFLPLCLADYNDCLVRHRQLSDDKTHAEIDAREREEEEEEKRRHREEEDRRREEEEKRRREEDELRRHHEAELRHHDEGKNLSGYFLLSYPREKSSSLQVPFYFSQIVFVPFLLQKMSAFLTFVDSTSTWPGWILLVPLHINTLIWVTIRYLLSTIFSSFFPGVLTNLFL